MPTIFADQPLVFPHPAFGWSWYVVLLSLLLASAYWDLRTHLIPKWLPLTLLALGLGGQLVRGTWLGLMDDEVWLLGRHGALVAAVDALLFGAAGFAVGFATFFAMWILRICGGGDVKLFAALSVWTGPKWALWLLAGSTAVLIVLAMGVMLSAFLRRGPSSALKAFSRRAGMPNEAKARGMTYSLPLVIASAIMLAWFWRYDLGLSFPR